MLTCSRAADDRFEEAVRLFADTFTASEGAEEGRLVAGLAHDLLASSSAADSFLFIAEDAGALAGAALFTRLRFPEDPQEAFILSPMAVAPRFQRRGTGQTLIHHALAALRAAGAKLVMSYGDPAYYAKSGFEQVSEAMIAPPQPLSHPHGWIGQSLTGEALSAVRGPCLCAEPLNNPAYW